MSVTRPRQVPPVSQIALSYKVTMLSIASLNHIVCNNWMIDLFVLKLFGRYLIINSNGKKEKHKISSVRAAM